MTTKLKYIGLLLGLLSTIISFIFFARQHGTYEFLVISGVLVSGIFFLIILLSKGTAKSKLFWTVIVIFAIIIQWLTEPILITSSYLIFLNSNDRDLAAVNKILSSKRGEIFMVYDKIKDKGNTLTQAEEDNLTSLKRKLNVNIIIKSEDGIYYELWGFLDIRLGVTYWTKKEKPAHNQNLKDNWYRYR